MEGAFLIAKDKIIVISQLTWKALCGKCTALCVNMLPNGELALFIGVFGATARDFAY